ncbi:restriction endonuclease subunit S [Brenneria corticis]|uniref:Type I restriction modification DNA specificity domain-containing protein n=1 Tax=Brenneria corticis TaxID=2173106 RepID=A0A2U1UBB0_9GAMM|nr:restriction endonuclease subunit S [Brenneria sp. CFCC 11842]PWC18966.1 hypothetical protein DDT56_03205 [Brenneria sp. CFCC 11842]
MSAGKLPEGWACTEIGDIANVVSGGTPKSGVVENFAPSGEGIAWLTPADLSGYKNKSISRGARDLSEAGYDSCSAKIMPMGSILFSSRAPIGYVAVASNEIATNQGFKSFVFTADVSPDYAYYYMRSIKHLAEEMGTGTTFKEISGSSAKTLPFFIAPLAEQKIIAEKLDTLLAQVDSTKARLEQIPKILKRFRQAMLAAAVSGKLIHKNIEEKILTKLGNISEDIRYGTSKKCSESDGRTAVLRIPNIGSGYIINNNLKYADFNPKELSSLALREGDLLLIRSNGSVDLVGKVAVISEHDTKYLFAGYLIRIRLNKEKVVPKYVSYCLKSPQLRQTIVNIARSTSGVNNINSKELASLELPLPQLPEQQEIVRRVEQLCAYADTIEKQVNTALSCVNHLTQSILAKAFRGDLTAQWREENPDLISGENSAAALLEKIKAERASSGGKKSSRKKA